MDVLHVFSALDTSYKFAGRTSTVNRLDRITQQFLTQASYQERAMLHTTNYTLGVNAIRIK